MTKAELVRKIARDAGITSRQAERALDSLVSNVSLALKKGESLKLIGFGTFRVAKRRAISGRSPITGKEIKIPATKVAKFRPGHKLRDTVK